MGYNKNLIIEKVRKYTNLGQSINMKGDMRGYLLKNQIKAAGIWEILHCLQIQPHASKSEKGSRSLYLSYIDLWL